MPTTTIIQGNVLYCEPLEVDVELLGSLLSIVIDCGPLEVDVELVGILSIGLSINTGPLEVTISLHSEPFVVGISECNWIQWSKIGKLDFTIDETNVAGKRPLDWKGCVSEILKLGSNIVVYGTNGVSVLAPSGVKWGLQTIHKLGVVCKAVGTDSEHYFIDTQYRLYKLTSEGLQRLDYSEYLSLLTNPKMSLDHETGIIYICDGDHGFVYSTKTGSFGLGPDNVSGIGTQSGTLYVVAPDPIIVPKFHIATDIYDFGTRKEKLY